MFASTFGAKKAAAVQWIVGYASFNEWQQWTTHNVWAAISQVENRAYDMNPIPPFISLPLELMTQEPKRGRDLVLSACYLNDS